MSASSAPPCLPSRRAVTARATLWAGERQESRNIDRLLQSLGIAPREPSKAMTTSAAPVPRASRRGSRLSAIPTLGVPRPPDSPLERLVPGGRVPAGACPGQPHLFLRSPRRASWLALAPGLRRLRHGWGVRSRSSRLVRRRSTPDPSSQTQGRPSHDRSRICHRRTKRKSASRARSQRSRGYGVAHQTVRRKLAPFVEAGLAHCVRCGELIPAGSAWDLGRDDFDRRLYTGRQRRRCNRSAAGKKSAELQRCKTSREW